MKVYDRTLLLCCIAVQGAAWLPNAFVPHSRREIALAAGRSGQDSFFFNDPSRMGSSMNSPFNQGPTGPLQKTTTTNRGPQVQYSPTSAGPMNRARPEPRGPVANPNIRSQSPPPPLEREERRDAVKLVDRVKIQGGSLKTWAFSTSERVLVSLETDGRPLDADVEVWTGPNNAPQKVKVYIEDGAKRTFNCILETAGSSNSIAIRNIAFMEFPMYASVSSVVEEPSIHPGTPSQIVQGGALRTYPFPREVKSIQVLLMTNGRPMNARIELLQGPNTNKQILDLYSEDGLERPFCAIIDTPGPGHVLRVINSSPMEFPMYSYVEPHDFGIDEIAPDEGVLMGPNF